MPLDSRYIACVVLKNTLRNHILTLQQISPDELLMTKMQLVTILASDHRIDDPVHSRKVKKEVIFILTQGLK